MTTSKAKLGRLLSLLDEAARLPDVEQTTDMIKAGLCRLIRSRAVQLPPECYQRAADHYARRLLHRNEALGYTVVAMTWGPGQSTPVHDHSGMWCVEGVWEGHIEVQQYELVAQDGERYRFEKRNSYHAGVASAGCLIPPFEYHHIANTDERETAVSIHIYGGEMTCCSVFKRRDDGWYSKEERRLRLD